MEKVIKLKLDKNLKKGEVRTLAEETYKERLAQDTAHLIRGESKRRVTNTTKYFIFIDVPEYSDLFIGEKGYLRSRLDEEWTYFFREYLCDHPTKLNKR